MNWRADRARLLRDTRGAAAIEFAVALPVFLMATLGLFDLTYEQYASAVLQGVVEKAGRDGSLEDFAADQSDLDAYIERSVRDVWPRADVLIERQSYAGFRERNQPEKFTDINGDGKYDKGECFEDANGNGTFDRNRGRRGNGSAEDVVLLTATIKMDRVFPGWELFGQSQVAEIVATMTLRNQPYAAASNAPKLVCGDNGR